MADRRSLPHVRQALVDALGSVTQPWLAWFQRVNISLDSGALSGETNAAAVATIATKLGSPDGTVGSIPTQPGAVVVNGNEGVNVAGNMASGGPINITLADLPNSATGTLLAITRDGKGRVTGTRELAIADTRTILDLLGSTAEGDLIYKGPSGWTRLAKGSNGQVVKLAAGLPTWANESAGGGGAMTLVGTATVAGSAATNLTLSGLDLAAAGRYVLLVNVGNATASSISLSLQYNGNATATNYYRILQSINAGGTAPVSAANNAIFSGAAASQSMWARIEIEADHTGRARAVFGAVRDAPATMVYQPGVHVYDIVANVTSLTVSSSVADSLAIGSSIKLFKVQ